MNYIPTSDKDIFCDANIHVTLQKYLFIDQEICRVDYSYNVIFRMQNNSLPVYLLYMLYEHAEKLPRARILFFKLSTCACYLWTNIHS